MDSPQTFPSTQNLLKTELNEAEILRRFLPLELSEVQQVIDRLDTRGKREDAYELVKKLYANSRQEARRFQSKVKDPAELVPPCVCPIAGYFKYLRALFAALVDLPSDTLTVPSDFAVKWSTEIDLDGLFKNPPTNPVEKEEQPDYGPWEFEFNTEEDYKKWVNQTSEKPQDLTFQMACRIQAAEGFYEMAAHLGALYFLIAPGAAEKQSPDEFKLDSTTTILRQFIWLWLVLKNCGQHSKSVHDMMKLLVKANQLETSIQKFEAKGKSNFSKKIKSLLLGH